MGLPCVKYYIISFIFIILLLILIIKIDFNTFNIIDFYLANSSSAKGKVN